MKAIAQHLLLSACVVALSQGCGERPPSSPTKDDTTTTGRVLVLADEELRSIVDAEAFIFQNAYHEAQLDIRYLPERALLKEMLSDSVRCVITTAKPGGDQDEFLRARKVEAEAVPICTDAIAVVVNKSSGLQRLDLATIRALLRGDAGTDEGTRYVALVAGNGSGTARTLVDSLGLDANNLRARASANVAEVVTKVETDPNVCGFVPFAAISDLDNPEMRALRDRVKLLPIARNDTSQAFLPTQGTLADGSYPLRRQVYMVLTEAKSGLGTGFVSFVANHKGQRILLKSGLAPHKVPAREVEIVHQ